MANGRTSATYWDYENNRPAERPDADLRAFQGESGYRESGEPLTDRACVRCAHYRAGEADVRGQHLCERPQLGFTHDRVLGADIPNSRDAYIERRELDPSVGPVPTNFCGPEGKFWSQSGF